jgi:tripartite motif-containing protein 71
MESTLRLRRPRWLLMVAIVLAPLLLGIRAAPVHATTFVAPHWVRQIGQSGHATLYAWGMAHEPDGTLVVSDYNNYNMKLYSTSGTLLKTFGVRGTGPGQVSQPYTTAVDPIDGSIYVANPIGQNVLKYDSQGNYLSSVVITAPDLFLAQYNINYVYDAYINTDAQGHLWVVSSHNIDSPLAPPWPARVLEYDRQGNLMLEFGTNGTAPGQFQVIRGIAVSSTNNLVYVADSVRKKIVVFDQLGNYQFEFGSGGNLPGNFGGDLRQLATDDSRGLLYASDPSKLTVHEFSLNGAFLRDVGAGGVGYGQNEGLRGITVNIDGNLWAADYALFKILVYRPDGSTVTELPNPAAAPPPGGLNFPEGIGIDSTNGFVYVTDTFNNRLEKYTTGGSFVAQWGFRIDSLLSGNAMDYPRGAAVDPRNGNLWVNDTRAADIKGYTVTGSFIRAFGNQGSLDNQYLYSRGIWVMPNGNLLVPDTLNFRLKEIDQLGHVIAMVPCGTIPTTANGTSLLYGCTGVTMDSAGNIYVASPFDGYVIKFDGNLNQIGTIGTPGAGAGQLAAPYGVAVYGNTLYVNDAGANKVNAYDLGGNYLGSWGTRGKAHGQFNAPKGIAVDGSGNIYVVDTANERVEVFAP